MFKRKSQFLDPYVNKWIILLFLQQALQSNGEELTGEIAVIHQFVDMPVQVAAKYDPISGTFIAVSFYYNTYNNSAS